MILGLNPPLPKKYLVKITGLFWTTNLYKLLKKFVFVQNLKSIGQSFEPLESYIDRNVYIFFISLQTCSRGQQDRCSFHGRGSGSIYHHGHLNYFIFLWNFVNHLVTLLKRSIFQECFFRTIAYYRPLKYCMILSHVVTCFKYPV